MNTLPPYGFSIGLVPVHLDCALTLLLLQSSVISFSLCLGVTSVWLVWAREVSGEIRKGSCMGGSRMQLIFLAQRCGSLEAGRWTGSGLSSISILDDFVLTKSLTSTSVCLASFPILSTTSLKVVRMDFRGSAMVCLCLKQDRTRQAPLRSVISSCICYGLSCWVADWC